MKLLVDTSALVALLLRRDRHHRAAVEFVRANPHARFILTELVLAETVTIVRARAGAARAAAIARDLLASRRYDLLLLERDVVSGAIDRMERFADKRLSFTDCASFETMSRLGLRAAFSFDRDFRDCGHAMVP